ncbi:MAG: NAD-dependent epimerase/dehydratase family protein [Caldimonas sp.]
MRVLVTGAAGFLGRALVRELVRAPAGAAPAGFDASTMPRAGATALELVLTDRATASTDAAQSLVAPAGMRRIAGDIADAALLDRLFAEPPDVVFHLAGIVSGAAEADYAAGKRVNLDATIALLERCRLQTERGGPTPRFVYASSIAVFGTPLPRRIDDATAPAPTLSYGTHKRACELLIDDCTRRGYIDGRALRLSGIVVRPPLDNGALSGFNSDLIREPLAGRDYLCPVSPEATIWIASLRHAIANLLRIARAETLSAQRALTMPSLAVSVAEIVAALAKIDRRAPDHIRYRPDPKLEAQFGRWPLDCRFDRGVALGLEADASIDELLRAHLESA